MRGEHAQPHAVEAPMAQKLEQEPSSKQLNMGALAAGDNQASRESVAVQVQLFLVIDLLTLHFYLN